MQVIESDVTIGASAVLLSTLLPSWMSNKLVAKLFVQSRESSTGNIYIGSPSVTSAGANAYDTLAPGSGSAPGGTWAVEDQQNHNSVDATQYAVHGATPGDKVRVVLHVG